MSWLLRAGIAIATALVVHGCGAPTINWQVGLDSTDQAVREGNLTYAYLNLRSIWMQGPPEIRQAAIARGKQYPRVIEAGYRSLAKDSVAVPRDSRFEQWIAFHREFSAGIDLSKLMVDGRRFIDEDNAGVNAAEAERAAAEKKRLAEAVARHDAARRNAFWKCKGAQACDKVFALAQIFVNENADMKIQVATSTIVETFNPTDVGKSGMKIVKLPLSGDEAEIRLTVSCKAFGTGLGCLLSEAQIYERFPVFMRERFQQ